MSKAQVITDAPKPKRFNKKLTTLGAVALGVAAAGLIVNDKLKKLGVGTTDDQSNN